MRRLVLFVLAVVVSPAWLVCGQETTPSVASVDHSAVRELLPVDAAEFEIALGRLRLAPDRFRILRKHDQWHSGQRSYQVSACNGRPALRLSYTDPSEKWTLHIDGHCGAEFTRSFTLDNDEIEVHYRQQPHQAIEIAITVNAQAPQRLSGMTLWHLTDDNAPLFGQYVVPTLARINPTWDLPGALAAAKRLQSQCQLANMISEHQLAQHLADLDASDHRQRQLAKQKMTEAGLAAQIPLQKLRSGRLSPQQLSTVNELLAGLEPRSADTPTRLAYWLAGDPNLR